ncbi:MAG: hypothetical protein M5U34_45125 [Chloroflexi bacterium]|nr:hypothetical protein [Chloroflexota bacterium]
MPIGGTSRRRPDFSISIEPENPENRSLLTRIFLGRDRYNYHNWHYRDPNLTQTISKFIEDAAFTLVYKGTEHYEIVRDTWPTANSEKNDSTIQDTSETTEVVLSPQRIPGRIIRLPGFYLQLIPRSEWKNIGKKIIAIPAHDVWTLQIPQRLGGARGHEKLLRTLVLASNPLPRFVLDDMAQFSDTSYFSHNEFHTNQQLAVARETAIWGWPSRDIWMENTLEYFRIYRHLRFAFSMAVLREYILDSMNKLLERINFSSRISLKGLPSPKEIEEHLEKLEEGQVTFDDALKAIEI